LNSHEVGEEEVFAGGEKREGERSEAHPTCEGGNLWRNVDIWWWANLICRRKSNCVFDRVARSFGVTEKILC